jgi:hypothetical protein
MMKTVRIVAPALAAAALLLVASAAQAQCVSKAGQGTGSTDENAKFQAWEAVLQATDWGSWASFMAASQKVGSAPGYKVSNLKMRCKAGGGLGRECVVQAKLCK